MTVELRHFRAFLAIVDRGTFSSAATALHVSQPALSRTVAQLEAAVGERLLDRSTHHCEITEAGQRFISGARDAVRAADDAVALARGRQRQLVLGHSWSAATYLARIVRAWNSADRPCELAVVKVEDRMGGLDHRSVDAAIVRGEIDPDQYDVAVLDEEPRVAVLPEDHPRARARRLHLADLAGGRLLTAATGLTTVSLWPEGHRPSTASPLRGLDDWLVAIAAGTGFGVSVASTAELHPHPQVRYVPLVDAARVPVLLAFPSRSSHPSSGLLREVATHLPRRRPSTR